MEHTSNYQLSKWNEEDRILMEDFNMDHDKIDAALQAAAEAAAAAATGGLKIKTGSFSGTGTTGTRTYSIGVKPKLVLARTDFNSLDYVHKRGLVISEIMTFCFTNFDGCSFHDPGDLCTITDDGFTINHTNTALNNSGNTLYYWVLY